MATTTLRVLAARSLAQPLARSAGPALAQWTRCAAAAAGSPEPALRRKLKPHEVLFESNHLLLVNKPAGLPSQSDSVAGRNNATAMVQALIKEKQHKPGNVFVGLLHRLDRVASGILCFAKTSKAATRMQKLFAEKKVRKEYLVVVEGILEGKGVVQGGTSYKEYWQSRPRSSGWEDRRTSYHDKPDSDLEYIVLRNAFSHESEMLEPFTVVAVRLRAGRKHQIRRQLASLGHPIVGDALYGSRTKMSPSGTTRGGSTAIMLHCCEVLFPNPVQTDPADVPSRNRKEFNLKRIPPTIRVFSAPPSSWRKVIKGISLPELSASQSYFSYALKERRQLRDFDESFTVGEEELRRTFE